MFCPLWFCNHFAEGRRVVLSSLVLQSFPEGGRVVFILSGFAIISLKEEELFYPLWCCNYFAKGGRVVLSSLVLQSFR